MKFNIWIKYTPTDFFDGCRQGDREKRQESRQADMGVAGISIHTPVFKTGILVKKFLKTKGPKGSQKKGLKKNKKHNLIQFHNTCFYQTRSLAKDTKGSQKK